MPKASQQIKTILNKLNTNPYALAMATSTASENIYHWMAGRPASRKKFEQIHELYKIITRPGFRPKYKQYTWEQIVDLMMPYYLDASPVRRNFFMPDGNAADTIDIVEVVQYLEGKGEVDPGYDPEEWAQAKDDDFIHDIRTPMMYKYRLIMGPGLMRLGMTLEQVNGLNDFFVLWHVTDLALKKGSIYDRAVVHGLVDPDAYSASKKAREDLKERRRESNQLLQGIFEKFNLTQEMIGDVFLAAESLLLHDLYHNGPISKDIRKTFPSLLVDRRS